MKQRAIAVSIATVVALALIGVYIGLYLTAKPSGTFTAKSSTSGGVNLYLATVPAAETTDPHPTWVSYYAVNPNGSDWRHDTTYVVPANTTVHVTIYQYDGDSGLRNEFLGQSTGTDGNDFLLNGKPTQAINPSTASHIFAIPNMGVSVPLQGVNANAKNQCANAPCTLQNAHMTISFSFKTGAKGVYRWQCFVPCAAGFIQGLGGPMQTVGYMDGYLKVV